MTMNGAVIPVMAFYIVAAERQGVAQDQLSGTIQNDILKEFMVRNTYIYPPGPSMRIVSDIIAYTLREMPKFNCISISGYHMHEAGATAVQELAFTIADGKEYVKRAMERGPRHRRLRRAAVVLLRHRHEPVHGSRQAARRAHAVVRSDGGTGRANRDARKCCAPIARRRASRCRSRTPTTTSSAPRSRRWRRCSAGRRSLHTNALDEALALPTDFSARIARNTQLVLAEETGITNVVDPLGGSYYVEALTAELADKARTLIAEVDAVGGMTEAVASGPPSASSRKRRGQAGAGRPGRGRGHRRQQIPARRARPDRDARHRQPQGPRRPDRAHRRGAREARRGGVPGRAAGLAALPPTRRRPARRIRSPRAATNAACLRPGPRRTKTSRPRPTSWRSPSKRAQTPRWAKSRGDGERLRPLRDRADAGHRALRRGLCRRSALRAGRRRRRGGRRRLGRKPSCWSPRWARTATTAAPT